MSIKSSLCAVVLGAAIPALACLAPAQAQAATTFTFAGQVGVGTDPMGDGYALATDAGGLTHFLEGAGEQTDPTQQALFAPSAMGLSNAGAFTLTETGATDPILSLAAGFGVFFETFDANSNILGVWNAAESADGRSVTFTAPAGLVLTPGERFALDVTFDNPVPAGFTYDITWAAVPEPASWALMLAGVGLMGGVLRRRSRAAGAASA